MKTLSLWFIFVLGNTIAAFWLVYMGVFAWMIQVDITFISVLVLMLYSWSILSLLHDVKSKKPFKEKFDVQYFIANHLPALGLLGTVIGLMFAVNAMSSMNINVSDQSTIIKLMQQMFTALGTALVTTIVGLITSLMLKAQILIINSVHKHENA